MLPGLKIGGAYNKTYFNPEFTKVVFNGGGTDYWTIGAQGDWRNLEWGADWTRQNNGDIAFVPDPAGGPEPIAVGFSANGVEIYSRLKFGKFAAVLGFEDYIPLDLNPSLIPTSRRGTGFLAPNGTSQSLATRSSKRGSATQWMRWERTYPTRRPSASVTTLAGKPRIRSNDACPARVRKAAIAREGESRSRWYSGDGPMAASGGGGGRIKSA